MQLNRIDWIEMSCYYYSQQFLWFHLRQSIIMFGIIVLDSLYEHSHIARLTARPCRRGRNYLCKPVIFRQTPAVSWSHDCFHMNHSTCERVLEVVVYDVDQFALHGLVKIILMLIALLRSEMIAFHSVVIVLC